MLQERKSHKVCFLFLIGLLMFLRPGTQGLAQNVEVIEQRGEGYYLHIDGRDYLAFPVERVRKQLFLLDSLKIEQTFLQRRVAAQDSLITVLDRTNRVYARNFALQDSLLSQTHQLFRGYRDLYFNYKAAYHEPWLYFSGGLGAVRESGPNGDIIPVFLMGITLRRLSLWGFINSQQSGMIFGVTSPIRLF